MALERVRGVSGGSGLERGLVRRRTGVGWQTRASNAVALSRSHGGQQPVEGWCWWQGKARGRERGGGCARQGCGDTLIPFDAG